VSHNSVGSEGSFENAAAKDSPDVGEGAVMHKSVTRIHWRER
jgi:hypothetical protein